MKTIEKIRQKIEELYDGEAPKHDQQCDFSDGYFTGLSVISNFLDTLSEEPDKVLEGEVILNGHGLLVDVTKWDNGYKLKVIIKEGEYEETIKED